MKSGIGFFMCVGFLNRYCALLEILTLSDSFIGVVLATRV